MKYVHVAASACALVLCTSAMAAQRTFVASSGSDAQPCSLSAPCRTFAAAISHTDANGEVIVLDSAGYGGVTISQSVSIITPPGIYAGISVFSGNDGVTIAAGTNGNVVLRGLSITGQGGNRGIVVTSAHQVHVEQCTISNMAGDGIAIAASGSIHVRDSIVRGNAGNGLQVLGFEPKLYIERSSFARNTGTGVLVRSGTLDATAVVANDNGGTGIDVEPNAGDDVVASIAHSAVSGNGSAGILAHATTEAASAKLGVTHTMSSRNWGAGFGASSTQATSTASASVSHSAALHGYGAGAWAYGAAATLNVSTSMISGNGSLGWADFSQTNGGVLRSSGNNTLSGNGASDVSGTITPNPMH